MGWKLEEKGELLFNFYLLGMIINNVKDLWTFNIFKWR
jgi:hypothetical protein